MVEDKVESMPVHLIESREEDVLEVSEEPEFMEIEVALDSACARHVGNKADFPNYTVKESEGSRRGQEFVTAAGDTISNEGEIVAAMVDPAARSINSTFQVTTVTRPLWSVSEILDNLPEGHEANFNKRSAAVRDSSGKVLAKFERKGGLCLCKLKLRNPKHQGFRRQG